MSNSTEVACAQRQHAASKQYEHHLSKKSRIELVGAQNDHNYIRSSKDDHDHVYHRGLGQGQYFGSGDADDVASAASGTGDRQLVAGQEGHMDDCMAAMVLMFLSCRPNGQQEVVGGGGGNNATAKGASTTQEISAKVCAKRNSEPIEMDTSSQKKLYQRSQHHFKRRPKSDDGDERADQKWRLNIREEVEEEDIDCEDRLVCAVNKRQQLVDDEMMFELQQVDQIDDTIAANQLVSGDSVGNNVVCGLVARPEAEVAAIPPGREMKDVNTVHVHHHKKHEQREEPENDDNENAFVEEEKLDIVGSGKLVVSLEEQQQYQQQQQAALRAVNLSNSNGKQQRQQQALRFRINNPVKTRTVFSCMWPGCPKNYDALEDIERHVRSHLGPKQCDSIGDEDFYYEETEVDEATYLAIFSRTSRLPLSPSHNSDGLSSGQSFASSSPATSPVCSTDSSSSISSSSSTSSYPANQLYANSIDWNHFLADHNQLLRAASAGGKWLPSGVFVGLNGEVSAKLAGGQQQQLMQQEHHTIYQNHRLGANSAGATSRFGPHTSEHPDRLLLADKGARQQEPKKQRQKKQHPQQQHYQSRNRKQHRAPSSPPPVLLAVPSLAAGGRHSARRAPMEAELSFSMQMGAGGANGSPVPSAPAASIAGCGSSLNHPKQQHQAGGAICGAPGAAGLSQQHPPIKSTTNRHLQDHLNSGGGSSRSNLLQHQQHYLAKQTLDHTYNSPAGGGAATGSATRRGSAAERRQQLLRGQSAGAKLAPEEPNCGNHARSNHLRTQHTLSQQFFHNQSTSSQQQHTTVAEKKQQAANHNSLNAISSSNSSISSSSSSNNNGSIGSRGSGSNGSSSSSSQQLPALACNLKLGGAQEQQPKTANAMPHTATLIGSGIGSGDSTNASANHCTVVRRVRGENRKCRKVYGMERRDLWCTQCKWKKACSRFCDQ